MWDEKKREIIHGRKAILFLYFKAIKKLCFKPNLAINNFGY
jgi:hypothetical protein